MGEWVASGRVLDWIVAGMGAEGVVLMVVWRAFGRGVPPGALLPNLVSGMCLLGGMRVGLAGGWWGWVGALLAGAGVMHGVDLRRRWAG